MADVLTLLQATGSSPRWSSSRTSISLCPFFASYSQFFCYDLPYSSSAVVPICSLRLSTPFLHSTLCTGHLHVLCSYGTAEFPMSGCLHDGQTRRLSFAPCVAHVSALLYTDPNTLPHIPDTRCPVFHTLLFLNKIGRIIIR